MKSVLIPSPILNLIPMLTPQQQKILKGQITSNLDIQKYKNGKILFLAYIEARSYQDQSDRYKKFVQQFRELNYVNKILKISSLRYYRDIRSLLIGGEAVLEIFKDKRFKYIKIDGIIQQLEDIAENRKVSKAKIQQNKQKNSLYMQIQSPVKNIQKSDQQAHLEPQSQVKFVRTVQKNRIIKKTLTNNLLYQSPHKSDNKEQIQQTKSQTKNLPIQNKPIEIQIQNKNINNKTLKKYLTQTSLLQQEQQEKQYTSSQLNFLKLIKVQESKNPHPSMQSERLPNNKIPIVVESEKNLSIKSLSKKSALGSLQQNNLYHRRQYWDLNNENQKSSRSSNMVKTTPTPTPITQTTANKNLNLRKQTVMTKTLKKTGQHRPSLMETICSKIMQCFRGLKHQTSKPKHIGHKRQQQKQFLVKKNRNPDICVGKNSSFKKV